MAKNPFDQFDTPTAANPFDQFDETAAPPQGQIPAPPAAAATPGPVGGEATGTVLDGGAAFGIYPSAGRRQSPVVDPEVAKLAQRYPAPEQPGFFGQLGKSFGVGIDQGAAALNTIGVTAQDAAIKRTQEQLARLEASGQGQSEQARGLRMTLDHYTKRQGGAIASLAQQQASLAGAPIYPGVRALGQAPDFAAAWDVLKSDPLNIIANLGMQSLPTMAPGLAVGMVNPVAGAFTIGASSAGTELGSSLMEFAREQGVNTGDVEALKAFYSNPAMLDAAKQYAATRAGIIGAADALSAGVASKTLVPQAIKGPVARGVTNLAVQMPTQAAAGAAGEAGAQVATKGEITAPGEVVAEGAGGLFTAPLEVGAMAAGVARERAAQQRQAPNAFDQFDEQPAPMPRAERAPAQPAPEPVQPPPAPVGNAAQPQPTPTAPTNMATQPTATMGQAPVTAQAGPGFNAASVQQMLPATPPPEAPAQPATPEFDFDATERALTEERDRVTNEIEDGWMNGGERRRRTPIESAIYDAVTSPSLIPETAKSIFDVAVQAGRLDVAEYAVRRAENYANGLSTTPGVAENSPRYAAIKRDLERRKAEAVAAAAALRDALDQQRGNATTPTAPESIAQTPPDQAAAPAGIEPPAPAAVPAEGAAGGVEAVGVDGRFFRGVRKQGRANELGVLFLTPDRAVATRYAGDDGEVLSFADLPKNRQIDLTDLGGVARDEAIFNRLAEAIGEKAAERVMFSMRSDTAGNMDVYSITRNADGVAALREAGIDVVRFRQIDDGQGEYETVAVLNPQAAPAPVEPPASAPAVGVDTDRVTQILERMRAGDLRRPSMGAASMTATPEERASIEEMNRQASEAYEQAARQFLEGELPKAKPAKDQRLDIGLVNTLRGVQPQPIPKSAPLAKDFEGQLKVADIVAAKKDIRYYLNGIYLDPERNRIAATDGHRMLIMEADLTGRVPARPEGVNGDIIVNAKGEWATDPSQANGGGPGNPRPIDGKYPQIDRVIPPDLGRTRTVSIDAAALSARARGDIKAWSYASSGKFPPPTVLQIDDASWAFNGEYIADMADVFRRLGYDTFNLDLAAASAATATGGVKTSTALRAKSPDGKVTQVIMPLNGIDGESSFFAPIVFTNDAVAAKPSAKKATPKKKAVKDFLADEGITDPAVVDAVAAEYDRLTGDEDVQGEDAGDAAGAAQRGPVDEPAGAVPGGEQAEQQGLFQGAANAGRSAPRAATQRGADTAEAGAVNDRAAVSPERDTGAAPADRPSVPADNGRQANQRVKGAGKNQFVAASFTNRQSIWRDAFVELGYDPAQAELLPPARQLEILSKGLNQSFGLAGVQRSKRANTRESIDQLLDAYRGLQLMTHVLDLPTKAIGLNGTLALGLSSQGDYLGAYYPQGADGKSSDGIVTSDATIVMPGRSNSFAHEWGHALDYYIVSKYEGATKDLSGMIRKGESLSDQFPETVADSFRLLMNSLFFDQAEQAAKIMDLERRIEAAAQRNVDAKQLKAELARIKAGASQSPQGRSQFYQTSREYSPRSADYFTKPTEMLARSFEAYIAHKVEAAGGSTEFIAKGDYAYLSDAEARLAKTFPKNADRFNIFRAYDLLFDAIRAEQLLGSEPAANMPAGLRLSDPSIYYDDQIDSSTGKVRSLWQEEKRAWQLRSRQLEDIASRPADTRPLAKRLTDPVRAILVTNRGVLLSMERQYRNNPAAASAIRQVTMQIATDPGAGRETNADGTYAEAVDREFKRFHTRLSNIVGNQNLDLLTPAQRAELTDVLTAIDDEPMRADATITKAAAPLRELVNDLYYYNRNAGMDIGYVENGYLPRLIDEAIVTENADEFIRDATEVYRIIYERDTQRPSDADDIAEALKALDARMREAMIRAKDDVNLQAFVDARRELNKLLRALEAATKAAEPDQDAIDAAQAALAEFLDQNMDVFDEAYDYVGNVWSQQAAAEYQTRISYGSPENFSSHSPAGSFLKERKLPPQADKILAKYYIQDPVERISRYIQLSVRKAEFNRRFGRDVRSKEKNTKLYRMLEDMVNAGVSKADRDMVEKIVAQVTGTDRSTIPQQAQNLLGNIHALGQMTLLGRVVLTSLAEPITTAVQTGRPLDAFRAIALTIQEIANTGSVRERRQMARALGIVSGDMADEIITNRLGGQVGESGMMQRASAQFFRRIGLTGLTNAQRRAAMKLAGRYVLDLAHTLDDAEATANEKGMARDELIDAGLTDDQIEAFVEWSREFDSRMPRHDEVTDVDGSLTAMGKVYAIMVGRLVHQSIQSPTAIDRPYMANTVGGRLIYGLLSFVMAFFRNVVMKSGKKIVREYQARGAGHAAYVAGVQVLTPLATLYLGHLLVTVAREALLNPEKWEEEEKKGNLEKWLMQLAFSRTGFTGLADPIYNALLGVKYQRDLANILTGPSFSYFMQALQRIATYFVLNSPNTNSAERNAARGVYELAIQPSLAFGVGYLPGGPLLGYGLGASYAYMSSPAFKAQFQDLLAGEKNTTKARTGERDAGDKSKTGGW